MALSSATDLKIVQLVSNRPQIGKTVFFIKSAQNELYRPCVSGCTEHGLATWHFPVPQTLKIVLLVANHPQIGKSVLSIKSA